MHSIIKTYVDNGIEWLRQRDLLLRPTDNLPDEMRDETRNDQDDWKPWKAIPSLATDADLEDIENKIKYKLPTSYKDFLKYKHFLELHSADKFEPFGHIVHYWKENYLENYFHSELREYMLDKGYIWFGNYDDWGFLCFDANIPSPDNEYPVILIDHETIDQAQLIYKNFKECLIKNTFRS